MINIYTYNVYILSNVSKINILSNVKTLFITYLADIFFYSLKVIKIIIYGVF